MSLTDTHVPRAVYFEDFEEGQRFLTPTRTVTEADVVAFASLSGDFNALHTDRHFAEGTPYGQRIAHGLLVLSIASGLTARLAVSQAMQDNILGLLDLNSRWAAPTMMGDTLHVVVEIEDLTETSRPDRGVVTMRRDAVNHDGTVVMSSRWKLLVRRRGEEGP